VPLPDAWRGLNTEILSKASGIAGCVFCHHSGFIAGNSTFDGVLQMALHALRNAQIVASDKVAKSSSSGESSLPEDSIVGKMDSYHQ
jgi:hypothetical protein